MHSQSSYRFNRDVDALAPKPGHHLGTLTFNQGDERVVLWMIEGPDNDTLNFRGMATDFEETRLFRFGIRGPGIEQLNELPHDPNARGLDLDLSLEDDAVSPTRARVVYSPMRSPDRDEPDCALIRFDTASGASIDVTVAELRRGWSPTLTVAGAALALGACVAGARRFGPRYLQVRDRDARVRVEGGYELSASIAASPDRPAAPALPASQRAELASAESPLALTPEAAEG